jgi:DNA (cytosine-5)-methyltransferase 1
MGGEANHRPVGTYIDLFSGCGGLSLGLGNAGWRGLFAVEKDEMAFKTFKHNLIDGKYKHFDWPEWLPQKATTIQTLLKNHKEQLISLSGKIDLIAGGPPCQGFSMAGRRNPNDPRNELSNQYLKMVAVVNPKYIVLENVRGFNTVFTAASCKKGKIPQSMIVKAKLEKLGYTVFTDYVNSQDFGVPQKRLRFLMVGVRDDVLQEGVNPFELLKELRPDFLKKKGLSETPVTVKEAIGDFELKRNKLIFHSGLQDKGFKQLDYFPPKNLNAYQQVMRKGLSAAKPNSLRLARHKNSTIDKFKLIHDVCRPGVALSNVEREKIGTRKQTITVLHANMPSKTLTTLPDDILHYSEPRILTVRESARIQSFPDDFEFQGRYTTGGDRRKKECPRYTQVGNAVPPLVGEVLGVLIDYLNNKIRVSELGDR